MSSAQCPQIFFFFLSFASMRELLIYSSDEEIIFPTTCTHFVSNCFNFWCDQSFDTPNTRSYTCSCITGTTTEIAMLEWNVFHTSILFFFDRTKYFKTTVCFLSRSCDQSKSTHSSKCIALSSRYFSWNICLTWY